MTILPIDLALGPGLISKSLEFFSHTDCAVCCLARQGSVGRIVELEDN